MSMLHVTTETCRIVFVAPLRQSPSFPPDPAYRASLPCMPYDCYHAKPPLPVPTPLAISYGTWDGRTSLSPSPKIIVTMDTAPVAPTLTKVYCAYFDIERKWVVSDYSRTCQSVA